MSAIEIRAARKNYGAMPVLHGIDLDIRAGEFVVLVGPSGCGKSTLLRTIAGLEDLSSGEIRIGGRAVTDLPPRERDIAMVFQSYALYPHMSVADNMGYSLRLRRTPRERISQAIAGAAAKLGLDQLLERKPRALSGGQRQRVAMGRAIVRRPQAFLFDEPLSNLDARLREQMRGEIKKLHRELGATSIYVTHDQIEAMTLADRIVSMNGGVIQQVGTPLELYDRPANLFVAGFIGSPAMNMAEGRYALTSAGPAVALADGETVALAQPLPVAEGTSVTLGIRPEHVALAVPGAGAVTGIVELVEPTGLGVIVHAVVGTRGAGGADIKLFTLSRPALAIGDRVALDLPAPHLHLFDRETGNRIAA